MAPSDRSASLDRYLAGEEVPPDLDPETARALIEALVERKDAVRLQALASASAAKLAKEARRGLHLLRSRGTPAEVPTPTRAVGEPMRPATEHGEAWASAPDGIGERLISVLLPAAGGGWDIVHVRLSDEAGVLEAVRAQGPKKIWRGLLKKFDETDLAFAPIPIPYASWLVDEAYRRTSSLGRSPPTGFGAARAVLPPPEPSTQHPALALAPADLRPDEARALHRLADLRTWVPPRDVLGTLRLKLEEVETSKLFVDDRQRQEARLHAVDQAVALTFAGEALARWRRRLHDTAHVYQLADRPDEARRLRAQADRLGAAGFEPTGDPFCRAFVEKLLPPALSGGGIETTLVP